MSMKRILSTAAVTALLAAPLAACGSSDPDYASICVDPQTHERVADYHCHGHHHYGYGWFYYPMSSHYAVPRVGYRYNPSYGTMRPPRSAVVQKGGLPKAGGSSPQKAYQSATKTGGFGSTYKGGSSGSKSGGYKSGSSGSSGGYKSGGSSGGFKSGGSSGFSSGRR